MPRKVSQTDPALAIEFFLSGFYTHRSQLFAPFKGIGVNVVSFHDPVIDGHNMEDTDLYEWTRRPGFSIFCSVPLADGEVVNQFYSARNLSGTVLPFVDTTQRLAVFSPTSITTVLNKTTTAQSYVTTIGNMTYIADGAAADLTKYDGTNLSAWGLAAPTTIPVSTGLNFWQPHTHFNLGNAVQDTNGNIESVTAILIPNGAVESPTAFQTLALAGGTGTWAGSIGPNGTISETLSTPGHTNYLFFGTPNFVIPSGATILGFTVSVPKEILGGTAVDQSVKMIIGGAAAGVEHASGTAWSTSALTSIVYGNPNDNWGGLTPAQANANGPTGFGIGIAANILSTTFYSLVQAGVGSSAQSTSTVYAFPNPVTAGNTIVVGVLVFHAGVPTISDNHGNVYTLAASQTRTGGEESVYVFVASNVAAGNTIITTLTPGLQFNTITGINAHEFSGIVSVSPVAVTGANNSGGSSSLTPFNSGTVFVADATDLIFSYVWQGVGQTQPAGYTRATTGFILDSPGGSPFTVQPSSAFLIPGATGSFSPTWSQGTTGVTVVLKSAKSATAVIGSGSPALPIMTIYYKLPTGVGPGFSGANEPLWPDNLSNSVNDAGLAWTQYGPSTVWYPLTNYPTPIVIVDTNGFLQLATSAANPVQPWSSGKTYGVGDTVSFGGGFWISTAGSNLNIAPNANYNVATTVGSVVTTVAYWASTTNPAVTGTITPVWNTTVGGTTVDGSYTWTNIGHGTPLATTGYAYVYGFRTLYGHLTTSSPFSNNTGAILGPLNGSITGFSITSNVVTFTGSNNFLAGDIFTVNGLVIGTYLNEQAFTVISATPSQIFPLTSVQVNGSNVLIVQAINTLAAGQQVTFSGVVGATFLNGVTVTVSGTGLSGTQFEASFTHGAYGPTADTGEVLLNGSWTASFTHADVGAVSDNGVALPLISTVTGTGTGSPLCNSVATITGFSVTDNIITLIASNNFQPGLWVTISGLTNATYLNGQQVQVIAVDKPIGTANTQFQIFFETPNSAFVADSGTATFNAIEIYRTSDGGGSYLFAGAVTNPGAFLPWVFDDFVSDANLDVLLVAPLGHQNDPPPGAPGSTITTQVATITAYWNGRLWIAAGNFVYFTAGPDCTNGIPEESCPPGNRFQFAGPVIGLEPIPNGAGLLVYLADRVNVILGGPETISFYPDDFLNNFGISSPNALFKDGTQIGQFTTQAQYIELNGKDKVDVGEHIADYLASNFTPVKTYATQHRNGLDVGLFLSNGVDRIVRYGTNIGAWSVPAFPVFGAGALQSIETSVGTYSLMAASPTGGVTGSVALINPTSGVTTGAGTAWVNPSNIIAGNPASYATVTFASQGTSAILRASAYTLSSLPDTSVVQGIQVSITGKQSEISGDLMVTIKPTGGGTSHTFAFGTSNTTVVLGGVTDTWNISGGSTPLNLINGALSFDITATLAGVSVTPEVFISEVQVTLTYQNPGNYLYARDVNSWGDCGVFGANNGTPYDDCDVVIGSITLSQLGGKMFPLQHVVGYFDAVGSLGAQNNGGASIPNVWILLNEINTTSNNGGIGFIQLPEWVCEPPTGQNQPSGTILALRWPVNMMNSELASQFVHHLQVKIQFEPENAPNTLKAIAFKEDQE